jgi:two-component system, cell cycle response regulator
MLLLPQGHTLIFASSGQEGLAKAMEVNPDLILLDVVMPDMDGFEVCRRLRANAPLAEVPIILITSLDDRDARLEGIKASADDFVTKPFDSVELRARVQSITRLNRYRRLQAERAKFQWVVEHAEDGYLILAEEGKEDVGITYANARARVYLGLPEGDGPIEASFMTWVHRAGCHCEPSAAWLDWPRPTKARTPSGETLTRYLVRPEAPNARAFWLQVDVLDLQSGGGRPLRLKDVTTQMAQMRDMRGFSAMVAHKLREPVGHIVGNLEILGKFFKEEVARAEVAELFDAAYKGGQQLRRDIDEVLRYTRDLPVLAQTGEAFKLERLQPTVTKMGDYLKLKDLNVFVEQCPNDARLALSRPATELILWELLVNARKFHPKHTPTVHVYVSCEIDRELTLTMAEDGSVEKRERVTQPTTVCLRVSDDGLTLSPEQLAHVFTPYFQGEKHFTGAVSGMGLGLSMVAALVWSAGGTCRLYNRASGPGVVVELTLPLA